MSVMHADTTPSERTERAGWQLEFDALLARSQLALERARVHLAQSEILRLRQQLELERTSRRRRFLGLRD